MIHFNAGSVVVRIVADASRFHAHMLGAGAGVSSLAATVGRATAGIALGFNPATAQSITLVSTLTAKVIGLGYAFSALFTGPFALFGAGSLKAFSDFEKGINDAIAAAGGVTARVRRELEQSVFDVILKGTTNSPAVLAESYYYAISAGLSAAQARAGLTHLNQFSVGGRLDMRRATDMVNDIQFALNLVDDDIDQHTRNIQRIVDVIAMASVRSNATIEQMSQSLVNKAATAMRLFNISLEEGAAALMVYSQQGTKAEIAGERLSVVLRDLQAVNITARAAWESQNLHVFDQLTGDMLPLANIIAQLETRMRGFNDEQKRALLLALQFPSRSVHALLPLIGKSQDIERFRRDLVEGSFGFNQRIAEDTMRSFSAQISAMWNKITMAAVLMGQHLAPAMASVNSQIERLVSWWVKLDESTRKGIVAFTGFLAMTGPFMVFTGYVIRLIVPLFTLVGIFGILSSVFTTGLMVIGLAAIIRHFGGLENAANAVATSIGGFVEKAGAFFLHFNENFDILLEYFQKNWWKLLYNAGVLLASFLGASLSWIGQWLSAIGTAFMRKLPEIVELAAIAFIALEMTLTNLGALALHIVGRILYNIGVMFVGWLGFLTNVFNTLFIQGGIISLFEVMGVYITTILSNLLKNIQVFAINARNAVARAIDPVMGMFLRDEAYVGLLDGLDPRHNARAQQAFNAIGDKFRQAWRESWRWTEGNLVGLISRDFEFPIHFQTIGTLLLQGWTNFVDAIKADWPALRALFDGITFPFQDVLTALGGLLHIEMPRLNLSLHRTLNTRDYTAMEGASLVGMSASPFQQLGTLVANAVAGRNLPHNVNAGLLAGLGANPMMSSAYLASIPGIYGPHGGAISGLGNNAPPLNTFSDIMFEQVSTRRFALDGPHGLSNTPKGGFKVEDHRTHELLGIIERNTSTAPPLIRRNGTP